MGFPGGSDSKEAACNTRNLGFILGSGRSPEDSQGQRNLAGYIQLMGSQRIGHD